MSADSLAVALMALDDPDTRDKVRAGDLSAFHPDVQLDADEERLVRAAAEEELDPEVAGYDAAASALFGAASSVQGNLTSGPVQNSFQEYMGNKFGGLHSAMAGPCSCMAAMGAMGFGGIA
jgi:hypothetical protein